MTTIETDLPLKIAQSLVNDDSELNRKNWSAYLITHNVPVMALLPLIHTEKRIATRFAWMLGGLCETNPSQVYPAISYFFSKRYEIKALNFNRSLAKMFHLAGVPPEIEGEAIDLLFKLLLDPKSNVQTKTTALLALEKLAAKYPDLKNELKLCVREQLGKNSISFEKKARKIMENLH